jgi:uncharacterized protein (TIGR03437 family)
MDGRVSATAGTPLPNVAASCTATIGGQPATVAYCGEAAELTSGVLQLNVLVPQSVTPGSAVPVTVTIGGVTSQAGVTLAIQ